MAAEIEFFFDFSSPYGYFGSTAIEALAARHGRTVRWRPILLGVIFRATGSGPLVSIPLKGDYARLDFKRTSRFHGIDFNMPDPFPISTTAPARAMLWTRAEHGEQQAVALAKALYRAYFVDNIDISLPANVVQVGTSLGLDAAALATGLDSAEARAQLKADTDEAMQRGVFGSPFVIVDGEPFWGFDHFAHIDAFLSGMTTAVAPPAAEPGAPGPIKGHRQMVDEASAKIRRYTVEEAMARLQDPDVQFVDIRDVRELEREGVVPGAMHAPRGMIEFWVDPSSPYHKPQFAQPKEFIFFCAAGWRSALTTATVQEMGLSNVADIEGGFGAWKAAGAPVVEKAKKA
jgi:2-hydroxychromene-2-carboxylate isomerase/rhodanese-related sulfurtransferase